MSSTKFNRSTFSAKQLESSIPFTERRRLTGEKPQELITLLGDRCDAILHRRRARRPDDQIRFITTLEALLANLVSAAFNRVDPNRFVAMSFNVNDYTGSDLSLTALAQARDALLDLGMVEGQRGYWRGLPDFPGADHSRRTRLRATPALRRLLSDFDCGLASLSWARRRNVSILRDAETDAPEPADVAASRKVLERLNGMTAAADIFLPEDAWRRIARRYSTAAGSADEQDRPAAGDTSATELYRAFKGDWGRGGRLYGGWWINLPKSERDHLMLNGSATIELDYARLHPTILYSRAGIELDFDPYLVPGLNGPGARNLGKRTFNRLINKTSRRRLSVPILKETDVDIAELPQGVTFREYLRAFVAHSEPIRPWFGSGEGLRLQREDSDLAVAVLDQLSRAGIVVLPIHDSFIVADRYAEDLREAMSSAFSRRYHFNPVIR